MSQHAHEVPTDQRAQGPSPVPRAAAAPGVCGAAGLIPIARPETLLALQRTAGNRAVARFVETLARPAADKRLIQRVAGNAAVTGYPRNGTPGRPTMARLEAKHHEHVERAALTAPGAGGGLTDAESSAVYMGNWSRDLSQVFVNNPVLKALGNDLIFEILNALAVSKFGKELNAKDFGVYSPREHIDNPAGQMSSELDQPAGATDDHHLAQEEDISSPEAISKLFTVNDAGLPAYLGRSIQYVEEQFNQAADLGRTPDGLYHMGNGMHTIEDLFAHSNYIEIAVGKLIQTNALPFSSTFKDELKKRGDLDPVETLSGKIKGGDRRPILTTGSFVMADTLVSLSEALTSFFNDFDPFAPSNKEHGRKTMEMILARYEGKHKAGDVIKSSMHSLGTGLKTQLAEMADKAITGDKPAEDASFLDKAVGAVRGAAGSAVSAGMKAAGSVLDVGIVEDFFAGAANTFAKLPLTDIYQFVIKGENAIDRGLKWVDQHLQDVPGYKTVKAWLNEQLDALRESLKSVITAAVKFTGEAIEKAFAEAKAEGTNIEAQIQQSIEEHVKNPEKRQELLSLPPEQQMAKLRDPNWCAQARLEISDADKEKLLADLSLPEYVRAGPSHSQIAKDHADSPFFGTATALGMHVDTQIKDKMIAVWQEGGKNQVDPSLAKNYAGEIPPELKDKLEHGTPAEKAEAARKAAKLAPDWEAYQRREEGEELRRTGAISGEEEEHGVDESYDALVALVAKLSTVIGELPATLRGLATRVERAAPDAAAKIRAIAAELPAGLEGLAAEIKGASDAAKMQELGDRLEKLAHEKHGLIARVQGTLNDAADAVEAADPALDDAAKGLREAARQGDKVLPQISDGLHKASVAMAKWWDHKVRSEKQAAHIHAVAAAGVQTGAWAPELAASHAKADTPARKELFDYVHMLFKHPWDVTWWEQPIRAWATSGDNMQRLEAYIKARNRDAMHHHH